MSRRGRELWVGMNGEVYNELHIGVQCLMFVAFPQIKSFLAIDVICVRLHVNVALVSTRTRSKHLSKGTKRLTWLQSFLTTAVMP